MGGQASTNSCSIEVKWSARSSNVRGKTALIFSMRFSNEKRAFSRSRERSTPRRSGLSGASASSPNIALPLVKYSSRLVCRSNSRPAIGVLGLPSVDPGADACNIVKDLFDGVETIVALDHDRCGSLASARVIEQL